MKKFHLNENYPGKLFYIFPLLLMLFTACEQENLPATQADEVNLEMEKKSERAEKTNTYYGPAVPYGKGVVRSLVTMNHEGDPVEIGLKISEKVLEGLPSHIDEFSLELHKKADKLPFDHIDLGWMVEGHEPFFYEFPHFDVHFYMISEEEKMQITDAEKAEILPAPQYWPASYFPTPGYEPYMGKHWLSEDAPELQEGGNFSQTFIYGSYDGDFIFLEPMITLEYLQEKLDESFEIPQPDEYQINNVYYPTRYRISYDEIKKEYSLVLYDMIWVD